MTDITPCRYRHYKGNDYTSLGVARQSEALEDLVVYRHKYGDRGLWGRPAAMFTETVVFDGKPVPRFELLMPGAED
jgi:cyclomaltodextrinase / maltogenic alpha-amylase / neopullulanase